jgi:hypothetical protein
LSNTMLKLTLWHAKTRWREFLRVGRGPAVSSEQIAAIPTSAKQFNWGAFWLTWIWAAGNKCVNVPTVLLALGMLIPYIGPVSALGLAIYSGRTGGRRAWLRQHISSNEEAFERRQQAWARIAWVVVGAFVLLLVTATVLGER